MSSFNVLKLTITVSKKNPANEIAYIQFDDKKTKNAFTYDFINELFEITKIINKSDRIAVIILTGSDNVFCSGGNIKEICNPESSMFDGSSAEIAKKYIDGIQKITLSLDDLKIPIIAAINGYAIGGGFDLALMCDIRIASENAIFSENFINLGLISGDGGAWYLPKLIGYSNAMYFSLTAEKISAGRAKELGIICRISEYTKLMSDVDDIAEKIATNSLPAIKATKFLLKNNHNDSLKKMLIDSAKIQGELHHSSEHKRAMSIFIEKFSK